MRRLILLLPILLLACRSSEIKNQTVDVPIAMAAKSPREVVEARGKKFAIATQGIAATKAAQQMMAQGGNLVDAAVAASFVISVERPQSTGIGGGGFFLYRKASTGQTFAVDFRERAPLKATTNMFLNSSGVADPELSQNSILGVGVPGLVAGLLEIHEKFGSLKREQVMAPAIELAEKGFPVYPQLFNALKDRAAVLKRDADAKKIFLNAQGEPWPVGTILVQKELSETLKLISKDGRQAFYEGPIAEKLVAYSKKSKGLLSMEDLKTYQVKWREPLMAKYRGYEVFSMPPPSSGGVHVLQFLKMLEKEPLAKEGFLSAQAIHQAASSLQSAFADRATYLGDPDFIQVPVKGLLSDQYLKQRRSEIPSHRARNSLEVRAGNPMPEESTQTTHLSLMDAEGNAIASTQTINGWMGSGLVATGTGIVLNNEMDDFSAQPGRPNLFGALGGKANAVEPRKTPLSSMSPTFLQREGQIQMSLGAPGGTRIISCVAETILNYTAFELPLYESVAAVRYHHQWQPDRIEMDEPGPAPQELAKLKTMGYEIKMGSVPCHVMAVTREGDELHAVADPRDIGTSAAQ